MGDEFGKTMKTQKTTVPFKVIHEEEQRALKEIWKTRKSQGKPGNEKKRFSLALSGGGIRSASFNLGVLQALAEKGLLSSVNYLSSVSGGGYINAWLTAWNRWRPFSEVAENAAIVGGPDEPKQIGHLRQYSNYLTPKTGILSADTWTMVATYMRNLVLNLLIITLALCGLLLIPRALLSVLDSPSTVDSYWLLSASLALMVLAVAVIAYNLLYIDTFNIRFKEHKFLKEQKWVQILVVGPVFASSVLLAIWVRTTSADPLPSLLSAAIQGIVVYLGAWLFGWGFYKVMLKPGAPEQKRESLKAIGGSLVILAIVGVLGGILFYYGAVWFLRFFIADSPLFYLLAPFVVVMLFSAVIVLHIGLAGTDFTDEMREWWSRLGSWFWIYCIGWMALWASAFQLPGLLRLIRESGWSEWIEGGTILGWLAATVGGVLAGKAPETEGKDSGSTKEIFVRVAPWIFAVGFVAFISLHVGRFMIPATESNTWDSPVMFGDGSIPLLYYYMGISIVLLLSSFVLAWRVDVNEFSMHAMYRNRLVRCFLGASNPNRKPHPFTGLDRNDDIPIADGFGSSYGGPFPIINTTLNISATERLDWQTRKAIPFSFTPLSFGHGEENIRLVDWRKGGDLKIGSCMAMSGAALSPNMGFHTNSAVSFLLTVFNVRLGQWFFNPKRLAPNDDFPRLTLFHLLFELFGLTSDKRRYVYLSDGGHFENLGLYELVRRECDMIVVSDAGADGNYTFADLGNAIEKCRVDLGVGIEDLDVEGLKPGDSGVSKKRFIEGKIRYKKKTGKLIYMKASLSGDEPTDVLAYKAKNPTFPHQSTADQWFDEAQFEAYRALGYHIAMGLQMNR